MVSGAGSARPWSRADARGGRRPVGLVTLLLALASAAVAAAPAAAAVQDPTPQTNGTVTALARSADRIYFGGRFTRVGEASGAGVDLAAATGARNRDFAAPGGAVNAAVDAVVSDGAGGWFIGGTFTMVGGVRRSRLAHLLADGSVDPAFAPSLDGAVAALALSGTTLYVGGSFSKVGAATRNRLAAIDVRSGEPTSFDAGLADHDASGAVADSVSALALSGSRLYAGGDMLKVVGATTRTNLIALEAASGDLVTGFDPRLDRPALALAAAGGKVYAGGRFTQVGGVTRNLIAAVAEQDGSLDAAFDPNVAGASSTNPGVTPRTVTALAVAGGKVYAGGTFSAVNGDKPRTGLAAFAVADGAVDAFDAKIDPVNGRGAVAALAVADGKVYAAGSFTRVNGTVTRNRLASFDATSGAVAPFDPNVDGPATALAVAGGRVYAGGSFSFAGTDSIRTGLASIRRDGTLDASFAPNLTNGDLTTNVTALLLAGGRLYVGGAFQQVGSAGRNGLAAVDPATGAVDTGFRASVSAPVNALALSGGKLYAGGVFLAAAGPDGAGVARNRMAAFDSATGAVDPAFDPNVNNDVEVLLLSGGRLYAGGAFTTVNGGTPRRRLAAFDAATGALDPTFAADGIGTEGIGSDGVSALALAAGKLYAGGRFKLYEGGVATARERLAAFDAATGALDAGFDPNVGGSVSALAFENGRLYAGGQFATVNGAPSPAPGPLTRGNLAALDPVTGAADQAFDPDMGGTVASLLASGSELVAGGAFTTVAGNQRRRLALVAPSLTGVVPDSPSTDAAPVIRGIALPGTTVRLYTTATCTGPVAAEGTAAQFAAGLPVTVMPDSSTTFRVQTTSPAGPASGCSASSITYVEDSTPPPLVELTDTDPDSPSSELTPAIKGVAEARATVRLYTNAACSGTPVATGPTERFASPGLTATVAVGSSTTFYATATDLAGNASACSTDSITYEGLVALTDTDPDSPANDNTPEIKGSAPPGSTVTLYTNATCTSAVAATGTAEQFASPGLTVTVSDNSTTTFHATTTPPGGPASACSTSSITYEEDSIAPGLPAIAETVPVSPSDDDTPQIKGTAPAGTTVRLYTNATCTSAVAATGTAAEFASPGLTPTVPGDSSTTFYAQAADAAGNLSGCSTSSITYVVRPTVTDSDPDSPADDNTPRIKGTAAPGSTVTLYTNATCTSAVAATGTAAEYTSTGLTVTVADDSSTTFHVKTTGPTPGCSTSFLTYVEDSTKPPLPTLTGTDPASPSSSLTPAVTGTAEKDSTVRLYTNPECTGEPVATGTAAQFASPGLSVTVAANAETTFHATATDAAGGTLGCSTSSIVYVSDVTPPAPGTITEIAPVSPANDNAPRVRGTAEAGARVELVTNLGPGNAGCSNAASAATGTAAEFASTGLTASPAFVPDDRVTDFYVKVIDAAGNGACSTTPVTYVEDSTPPASPRLTGTTPESPADDPGPRIFGVAEAGAAVDLYANASCTGAAVASGSAAQFAAPGLAVTVGADSSTTFRATATDRAGNVSACSSPLTYVETDPPAPAPAPPPLAPLAPLAPPPVPVAGGVTLAPNTGRVAKRLRLSSTGRVRLVLACRTLGKGAAPRRCAGTVRLTARLGGRNQTVATAKFSFPRTARKTLLVRLSARARPLIRRTVSATLTVTVTNARGGARKATKRLSILPPRAPVTRARAPRR